VIKLGAQESYEPRCRECHELPSARPTLDLAESAIDGALTAKVVDLGRARESLATR
jgi:hypothetical protein